MSGARRWPRSSAGERWIIDGNYGGTMELRFARADTVVFMDFPRWRYMPRVTKRRFQFRGRSRPDMAEGCPERLDLGFLKWLWDYPNAGRPRTLAALEGISSETHVIRLASPDEVVGFLKALSLRA